MGRGKNHIKKGERAEQRFVADFIKSFPDSRYDVASEKQNITEHWDVTIMRPNRMDLRVDVKAIRGDLNEDGTAAHTWAELLNVNGDSGSLLGAANTIAIEDRDYWVLVDRKRYLIHVLSNIREVGTKGYYSIWTRHNRMDKVVKVPMTHIYEIASYTIRKSCSTDLQQQPETSRP